MLRKIRKKLRSIDYGSPKFLILSAIWLAGTIALAVVFDRHESQATDFSRLSEFEIEVITNMRGGDLGYSLGRVVTNTAFGSFFLLIALNVFHKLTSRSMYDEDY